PGAPPPRRTSGRPRRRVALLLPLHGAGEARRTNARDGARRETDSPRRTAGVGQPCALSPLAGGAARLLARSGPLRHIPLCRRPPFVLLSLREREGVREVNCSLHLLALPPPSLERDHPHDRDRRKRDRDREKDAARPEARPRQQPCDRDLPQPEAEEVDDRRR